MAQWTHGLHNNLISQGINPNTGESLTNPVRPSALPDGEYPAGGKVWYVYKGNMYEGAPL
jgi:hypothetical protein